MDSVISLMLHAIPVACVAWTVTHEELFREVRDLLTERARLSQAVWRRKFFHLFLCEYCVAHWVTLVLLVVTDYRLCYADWRGVLMALFSLPWVANIYTSVYQRLRIDVRKDRAVADQEEQDNRASRSAA